MVDSCNSGAHQRLVRRSSSSTEHSTNLPANTVRIGLKRKRFRQRSPVRSVFVVFVPIVYLIFSVHEFRFYWSIHSQTAAENLTIIESMHKTEIGVPNASTVHRHAVPNVIIFTHYHDFLHHEIEVVDSRNLTEKETEMVALRENVHSIVRLHSGASARFLTDAQCVLTLERVIENAQDKKALVDYFEREKEGMFKGDLCRGAALYETGGLYFDVDLGVRQNIFEVLKKSTEFATIRVHLESAHMGDFFQAFIGATPHHPILARYLDLFLQYARGEIHLNGPLGVILLRRAYEDVMGKLPKQTEKHLLVVDDEKRVEVWQEFRYKPEFQANVLRHVPPPIWGGTKRACKFVVLASQTVQPLVVPFYSRIAGSRMCPRNMIDHRYKIDNPTL